MEDSTSLRALIICEGKDDRSILNWLIQYLKLDGLKVEEVGGKSNPSPKIKAILNKPEYILRPMTIAVIFDADERVDDSRISITNALKEAASEINHAVFLFPDNDSAGDLEDLCLRICKDQARLVCADTYIDCLTSYGVVDFKRSKLKMLAYLAAVKDGRRSIADVEKEIHFDREHPAIQKLIDFLQELSMVA